MIPENTHSLSNDVFATHKKERGASLVEYSLLVALIAIVSITALTKLGATVSDQFVSIEKVISGQE
jgi:Flp pilus assembly pilin Flp